MNNIHIFTSDETLIFNIAMHYEIVKKKYFEFLAQPIELSAAIYFDRFELGYRIFQYWSDSENRNN